MSIDRVLIVGLGSIGKRHLRLARMLLPDADIRVLRHQADMPTPEYADGCFARIEQALAFKPQLAVIANPATLHMQTAQPLAQAGVHLLIEKPLSASLDGVPDLLATCRAKQVHLLTGYNLRFLASLQCFRDLLQAQAIGRVCSVHCEIGQYLPSWRPGTDYRHSVSAQRELGGGALLELSHELDYLRWIFGKIAWVNASLTRQSDLEIDVEDSAHLILGFEPDNTDRQLIGSLSLDFVRHDTTRLCIAIGETGSLRWNGVTQVVEKFPAGEKQWHAVFHQQQQRDDSYLAEWRHFLDCINTGKPTLISGEDGFSVLQVIAAARQASASGSKVWIDEIETNRIKP